MFPFILIHELGHACCIHKITKKYGFDDKPIIVIGHKFDFDNLSGNVDSLSNIKFHKFDFFGFDVFWCKFFTKNGITLTPYFNCFSDDEIIKCAKSGYKSELIMSLFYALITLLLICLFKFSNYFIYLIFAIVPFVLCLIKFILVYDTLKCSSNKDYWLNPCNFPSKNIKEFYYAISSLF